MARDRQRAKQRKARRAQNPGPAASRRSRPLRRARWTTTCPSELGHLGRGRRVRGRDRRAAPDGRRRPRPRATPTTRSSRTSRIARPSVRPSPTRGRRRRPRRGARGAGRRRDAGRAQRCRPCGDPGRAHQARPRSLHRLPARVVGRAAARTVARPSTGHAGHRCGHRLRRRRRFVPRRRRLGRQEDRRLHHLRRRAALNPCIAGTSSTPTPDTRTRSNRTSSTAWSR